MNQLQLYPLRLDPMYLSRLWGGRRLSCLLAAPLSGDEPIDEAWVPGDRDDHQSPVATGPLKSETIGRLMKRYGVAVVFDIQQNSDITFRLFDWEQVDAKNVKPRPFQADQALACIDFEESSFGLIAPRVETTMPVGRDRLFDCEPFRLWLLLGQTLFPVGAAAEPRVLVCIAGSGQVEHRNTHYAAGNGVGLLLPAEAGVRTLLPNLEVTPLGIAVHGSQRIDANAMAQSAEARAHFANSQGWE